MPRRLLQEPHVLAHELRTPLAIIAGWLSLVRDGDVSPDRDMDQWTRGMAACDDAIRRLNVIISQACDEATALKLRSANLDSRLEELVDQTTRALQESRRVLNRVRARPVGHQAGVH